ncbi:MAG: hypothetical protein HYT93_00620 [Parcubacteria group bacterium]|nr:hypothetical protein [Parcubacteria group bacterium]
MPTEKFKTIDGEEEPKKHAHKTEHELQGLAHEYDCKVGENPRWCVYGRNRFGRIEVQHWIRPVDEDEFIARRMAKMENELGGDMKAHMTEWNENLKGKPVYEGSGSQFIPKKEKSKE